MDIKIVPLGAGQDVGRSCILVSLGGKNVMFDCGMHMGYHDARRFPDFSYISKTGNFTSALDCIIITHFHLDHCGALPFFTEMCGYHGPVYMTHPTKAICPILLEDYRKIAVERKGDKNFFTSAMIKDCMKKVVGVNVHQTVHVDDELEITAYYAGHVLGAAMFHVKVGEQSVVYTGDYNMTPDRHLGGAWIAKVRPDVLITESTYATTVRDSKRWRERDFLKRVHGCVENGGKVLIPVFALGRAQELCILLDTYWERRNLSVPIYFSAGLTEKATNYYRLFINWTNQKIKKTFVHRNMFDFKHIHPFERGMADDPGPMVLFATPGMLHAGTSLEVFKKWAGDERNMVILPGYCVVGTVGNKLTAGSQAPRKIEIDKNTTLEVKCKIKNLSFSAHADAKGIMQLIKQAEPRNVILVHGEKGKMQSLKQRVIREFGIPCFDPPNGTTVTIHTQPSIPVDLSRNLLKRQLKSNFYSNGENAAEHSFGEGRAVKRTRPPSRIPINGVLLMDANQGQSIKILDPSEAIQELGLTEHKLKFTSTTRIPDALDKASLLDELYSAFSKWMEPVVSRDLRCIKIRSLSVTIRENVNLVTSWLYEDEDVATHVLMIIGKVLSALEEASSSISSHDEEREMYKSYHDSEEDEEAEEEGEEGADRRKMKKADDDEEAANEAIDEEEEFEKHLPIREEDEEEEEELEEGEIL
ncbi:Integrator complex subunit 11 [Balamuthia mandrillaris]